MIEACVERVRAGDPDRFLATMSVPPAARTVLFPLYAFNVEVARAPWVTAEPMIGEMRLQWWRDVLEEIAGGGPVRNHEIATPLAAVLDAEAAKALDPLVAARRWDLYRDPFEDEAAFWAHLDDTAGVLLWTAARLLGAPASDEAAVRAVARAQGLANWFLAIPALEAQGRKPLHDGRANAVRALAGQGREALRLSPASKVGRWCARAAWRAPALLKQAERHPERVVTGLTQSEFARRGSLLLKSLF